METANLKLKKMDDERYKLSKKTGNTWNFIYLTYQELRMIGEIGLVGENTLSRPMEKNIAPIRPNLMDGGR